MLSLANESVRSSTQNPRAVAEVGLFGDIDAEIPAGNGDGLFFRVNVKIVCVTL
jgi:hypothetical protein